METVGQGLGPGGPMLPGGRPSVQAIDRGADKRTIARQPRTGESPLTARNLPVGRVRLPRWEVRSAGACGRTTETRRDPN